MSEKDVIAPGAIVSKAEERKVIFASSLGTVFEWYDFYLYATLAPFFAALFFPRATRPRRCCRRSRPTRPASWCARSARIVFGRIGDLVGRKYTFLVTIVGDGRVDVRGRPAADLRSDRLGGAGPAGDAAPAAGPGARRRVRRRRDLRRRARAERPARLRHELDPDHGDAGLLPVAAGHRPVPRHTMDAKAFCETGAGAFRSWCRSCCWSSRSTSGSSCNESPVFQQMKAEGKGSKAPLTDSFLRYPNNKYVLLALLGATAGQGVVWYTGQFYALFFLTITLKLDYVDGLHADRRVALLHRHAVLHLVRLAVGQDRAAEDHPGRLPDRRADLLPAVQGAHALREPGAGGVHGEDADHGRGDRLQLPHLRRARGPSSRDCDNAPRTS